MNRKKVVSAISALNDEHCENCPVRKERARNHFMSGKDGICFNCPIGIQMRNLGKQLSFEGEEIHRWNKEESYYAVNHIDVLGLEKGIKKVANRLALDELHVQAHYFRVKQKTRHIAV